MVDWLNFLVFIEKKCESGNCSIQIGRFLLEQGCWSEAARALNKGIEKGNLDDSNEAYTLLEKCNHALGNSKYKTIVANTAL